MSDYCVHRKNPPCIACDTLGDPKPDAFLAAIKPIMDRGRNLDADELGDLQRDCESIRDFVLREDETVRALVKHVEEDGCCCGADDWPNEPVGVCDRCRVLAAWKEKCK